jgi:biotin transport system substrate-specific component
MQNFASQAIPNQTVYTELALIGGGAALTAIGAQVSVPWQPVPFTLQTLSVMICGLALGARRGALSQVTYLAAGSIGLPIFAEGTSGMAKIAGPTGGYLVSFVVVAWVLGTAADKGWTTHWGKTVVAFLAGILINLGLGTLWLAGYVGLAKALQLGFLPFFGIEMAKAMIASPALPITFRLRSPKV